MAVENIRDNVSLLAVKAYVDEGESIDLLDRFEMPVDRPGTKDVPAIRWTDDDIGVSTGFWSAE